MDTVEAVNTHCKKVNDFRDSKMLPSATPMKIIPEEWRGVTSVVTPFGEQTMLTISEQGLYFFLGRSDKPKALPYQMWVAGDVANALGYVDTTQAIRMHCKKVNKFSYGDMPQGAEAFGKEHFHVLRDIRETIDKCSESFTAPNFGFSEYTDSTGRSLDGVESDIDN